MSSLPCAVSGNAQQNNPLLSWQVRPRGLLAWGLNNEGHPPRLILDRQRQGTGQGVRSQHLTRISSRKGRIVARPLRIQYPGALYHVTSRGNERKTVFRNDTDRNKFLSYLQSAHEKYGAIIHCFCLLCNHYHILLETPRANLSQILHHINGAYTIYFNIKRKRSGHLFQGRFRAILVEKEPYALELSRYIHLNPYRAGLVEAFSSYRWSSYSCYLGTAKRPSWLESSMILDHFSSDEKEAHKAYRCFVEEAIGKTAASPLKDVVASAFLGSEDFIQAAAKKAAIVPRGDARDIPALRAVQSKTTLTEMKEIVQKIFGPEDTLLPKFLLYVSHRWGDYSLRELGDYFGMKGGAVSQAARRFRSLIQENPSLQRIEQKIVRELGFVEC